LKIFSDKKESIIFIKNERILSDRGITLLTQHRWMAFDSPLEIDKSYYATNAFRMQDDPYAARFVAADSISYPGFTKKLLQKSFEFYTGTPFLLATVPRRNRPLLQLVST
jgi:hypothetical protein